MGRFLLILIVGAVLGSFTLVASRADTDRGARMMQRGGQDQSLARSAADAAHAAVVGDMIDPATRRFRAALTLPAALAFGGDRARIDDYRLEEGGRVAEFTVTGFSGGVAHRLTSRYRIGAADFPGPLWLDTPYATADISADATINGTAPDGPARPLYFDAARFDLYNLRTALDPDDLRRDLTRDLGRAQGTAAPLQVVPEMTPVLAATGTPTIAELSARALASFDAVRDVRFAGGLVVSGARTFGPNQIVHVQGALRVPEGDSLSGSGLLLVEGDVHVQGTLAWDGLVLVATPAQALAVNFDGGTVAVRGALLVDQEAPPPGGHTDLTVYRDLSGAWATTAGEGGNPATRRSTHLRHTHRIDHALGHRRFVFLGEGNPHESYTAFQNTLTALGAQEVYLEFMNARNHGLATWTVGLGGEEHVGTVRAGFDGTPLARAGNRHATRTFRAAQLERLVVDVRSLRVLQRLMDELVSTSPDCNAAWDTRPAFDTWVGGCLSNNRVPATGWLWDRDGALTVQVRRAADGKRLYDGLLYWHTKASSHPQRAEELAADAAWLDGIRTGAAYGARLTFDAGTTLDFDLARIAPVADRLGLEGDAVVHLGTISRQIATP
jgi:hypothetical protein